MKRNQEVFKKQIAESMATTNNQAETARQLGVHKSTVCRIVKEDDVRVMIETEQLKFLTSLPNARENIQHLVDNYRQKDESGLPILDKEERDKAWKSSMEMLRSAGMLPSNSMSIFIQNTYNQQNNTILSPIIKELLEAQGKYMEDLIGEEEKDDG